MPSYTHGGYSVRVGDDGSIQVKEGDKVEHYFIAMYRREVFPNKPDYMPNEHDLMRKVFGRRIGAHGKNVGSIKSFLEQGDVETINAQETLYHIPTYEKSLGTLGNPVPIDLTSDISLDRLARTIADILIMIISRSPSLPGPYSPGRDVIMRSVERQVQVGQYFITRDDRTVIWQLKMSGTKKKIVPANSAAQRELMKIMGSDWQKYRHSPAFI